MKYIFTATKTEAQAIVEYYRLTKVASTPFVTYANKDLFVCVTGVGKENLLRFLDLFDKSYTITTNDTLYNIGIAAAPKEFPIGSLHRVQTLIYNDEILQLPTKGITLLSVDTPQTTQTKYFVDMEGFFIAQHFLKTNLTIYKVVSDHFQPHVVQKDSVKKLLKEALKKI
jgi:hypothetical protein